MKKTIIFFVCLALFASVFLFIDAQYLTDTLGVRNSYLLMFIVALFGGLSAGGSATFVSVFIAMINGGLDPYVLGLIGGVGLSIGDLALYHLARHGRGLIRGVLSDKIDIVSDYMTKTEGRQKLIPWALYGYISFVPLPNDLVLVPMAGIKYPPIRVTWIVVAGSVTFTLLLAIVTYHGIQIFS